MNIPDINEYFERFRNMKPYLFINEEEWSYIKDTWEKPVVCDKLAEIAMGYPLPLVDITEADAISEYMRLKSVRWNELLTEEEWFPRKVVDNKYDLRYKGKYMLFTRYNGGNKASDYFQQLNRWSISGSQGPGPLRTWENHPFMVTLMGALYTLKMPVIDQKGLRVALSLRKYTASQFKPSVAKSIYDFFKAETILDFSMGWGDRLCGFYASETGKKYVGLDPRVENHPIYRKQIEFYEKHNGWFEHEREVEMYTSPAEDFDFGPYRETFDLIFTSPPYFNVEKYSDDDTQSYIRYRSIDRWNTEFLQKALGNMIPALKSGGVMAINISDVHSSSAGQKKGYLSIVTPMCDFLVESGMIYEGCMGMEMAKRPNSGGAGMARSTEYHNWSDEVLELADESQTQKFAEPIWIFRKP
jgi:hypothetical protein